MLWQESLLVITAVFEKCVRRTARWHDNGHFVAIVIVRHFFRGSKQSCAEAAAAMLPIHNQRLDVRERSGDFYDRRPDVHFAIASDEVFLLLMPNHGETIKAA